MKTIRFLAMRLACGGLVVVLGTLCSRSCVAQTNAPRYVVDPYWPKPLPDRWVTGEVAGVCLDSKDHVFIEHRVNDFGGGDNHREGLTDNELDAGQAAPPVIEFDPEGNVVNSWGDPKVLPKDLHGCAIDREGNIWLAGSQDGIVQEYSHDGSKLLLQIGKRGVFDSSDGTINGTPLNSSHTQFFMVSDIEIDPANDDVYVSDGGAKSRGGPSGNHRIAVFDHGGHFLRQWELHRAPEEVGDTFTQTPHCVRVSNDGLVYVCDRWVNRLQVFGKMGTFQKNIPSPFKVWTPAPATGPGARNGSLKVGSASGMAFSRDAGQKFLFVINEIDEQINIVDRATGEMLGSFGRPGHQVGELMHAHTIDVDSKGNIYIGESVDGRRVQKFKLADIQ